MAILRSFIFVLESNLPRPDGLPAVRHPDDIFLRDDVILKNVSHPTIWGGIFTIAASLIPNNGVWKPVIGLAKRRILAPPVWRNRTFQRNPATPVQRRLDHDRFKVNRSWAMSLNYHMILSKKSATFWDHALASPEFIKMIDRPRPAAGAEFIGGG